MKPNLSMLLKNLEKRAPASDRELRDLKRLLGPKAPQDLLDFYASSNGATGYVGESDAALHLRPVADIISLNEEFEINETVRGAVLLGTDGTTSGGYFLLTRRRPPRYVFADILALDDKDEWVDLGDTFERFLRNIEELNKAETEHRDPKLDIGDPGRLRRSQEKKLAEVELSQEYRSIKLPRGVNYLRFLAYGPGGHQCHFAAGNDYCCNLESGEFSSTSGNHLEPRTRMPDPSQIICAHHSYSEEVQLWDTKEGKSLRAFTIPEYSAVVSAAVNGRGDLLLVAAYNFGGNNPGIGRVCLWDLRENRAIRWFGKAGIRIPMPRAPREIAVRSVGISSESKLAAAHFSRIGAMEGWITLYDVSCGDPIRQYEFRPDEEAVLRFSPCEGFLLACHICEFAVWDVQSGKRVVGLSREDPKDGFMAAAFVPSRPWVVLGTLRQGIQVWQIPEGKMVHHYQGKRATTRQLAISPDGKEMISWGESGGGNPLRLWRLPEGE